MSCNCQSEIERLEKRISQLTEIGKIHNQIVNAKDKSEDALQRAYLKLQSAVIAELDFIKTLLEGEAVEEAVSECDIAILKYKMIQDQMFETKAKQALRRVGIYLNLK